MSDTCCRTKSIRRQFEHIWRKVRSQLSRTRLHRQITWCNAVINRDKAEYYNPVINDNGRDPKKLWQALRQVLNKGCKMTVPQTNPWLINLFSSLLKKNQEDLRYVFDIYHNCCTTHGLTPPTCLTPVRCQRMRYLRL